MSPYERSVAAEVAHLGRCCWCENVATRTLVYRDGWRDPACREHAYEYGGCGGILTVEERK